MCAPELGASARSTVPNARCPTLFTPSLKEASLSTERVHLCCLSRLLTLSLASLHKGTGEPCRTRLVRSAGAPRVHQIVRRH
eukprot:6190532-Pleurochrysis_carterae.AAC.1